jgi:hypothetical protein
MKNLPNLDTETLCYIIENDLSRKDYEKLLTHRRLKINPEDKSPPDLCPRKQDDDLIISPS